MVTALTHTFAAGNGTVTLGCRSTFSNWSARYAKIVATRVGRQTRTAVTG